MEGHRFGKLSRKSVTETGTGTRNENGYLFTLCSSPNSSWIRKSEQENVLTLTNENVETDQYSFTDLVGRLLYTLRVPLLDSGRLGLLHHLIGSCCLG